MLFLWILLLELDWNLKCHAGEENHLGVLLYDSVALDEELTKVGDEIGEMRVFIL